MQNIQNIQKGAAGLQCPSAVKATPVFVLPSPSSPVCQARDKNISENRNLQSFIADVLKCFLLRVILALCVFNLILLSRKIFYENVSPTG